MLTQDSIPEDYLKFKSSGAGDIPPWHFIDGDEVREVALAIEQEYPWHRDLHPFALRTDIEDAAFFVKEGDAVCVKIVHSGSSRGFELDGVFTSFSDWLAFARRPPTP